MKYSKPASRKKEAAKVIQLLESKAEEKFAEKKELLATRQDITSVRLELRETKSDIIKWMFIFWASSTIATISGLAAIVHFMVLK
jgi:hypothetical protein